MLSQFVTQFSVFVPDLTQFYDHLQIVIWPQARSLLRFWTTMWMGAFWLLNPQSLKPSLYAHVATGTRACETLDVMA